MNAASYVGDVSGGKVETAVSSQHLALSHYGPVPRRSDWRERLLRGNGEGQHLALSSSPIVWTNSDVTTSGQ